MITDHDTPAATSTRTFREAAVLRMSQRLARNLRGLHTSAASHQQARETIDRYARQWFVRPGVGGAGLVAFLCSPESASIELAEIDAMIERLARPGAAPGGDYERATDAMARLVATAQAH